MAGFAETYQLKFPTAKLRQQKQSNQSKINKITWRSVLTQNTNEFCRNTTLHGLKYIASRELNTIERIFFAISFFAVVIISGCFILRVYTKWATTPIILGINPQPTFITNEPFPAITICNLNQALKSKAMSYSIYSQEFAMLQLLCKRPVNSTVADTITDWSKLDQFIWNISQPCKDMLVMCRYGAVEYNCDELFKPIITDEGLCCVFNMLNPEFMYDPKTYVYLHHAKSTDYLVSGFTSVDWYAEAGYLTRLPLRNITPFVAIGTGESLGLTIVLNVQSEEYYCSSANSFGFKIAQHSPNEAPNVRETGLLLAPGVETKVRISPEKTMTEQRLRAVHKRYRHCLFHSEGDLLFFSHYTQRNCELECVAQVMMKHCGCLSFYMPKVHTNTTTCSINDYNCVEKVRLNTNSYDPDMCCNACMPSCYDLTFSADFFWAPLSKDGFLMNRKIKNLSYQYVIKNIAIVNIYFKENSYRSSIQTEFIGIADFLSSVGGIMGLFVGFSFLSIIEFIYYAIIRPCRTIKQSKCVQQKCSSNIMRRPACNHQQWPPIKNSFRIRYTDQFMPYDNKLVKRSSSTAVNTYHIYETIKRESLKSISASIEEHKRNSINKM